MVNRLILKHCRPQKEDRSATEPVPYRSNNKHTASVVTDLIDMAYIGYVKPVAGNCFGAHSDVYPCERPSAAVVSV